jgi:hypothetical protein
MVSKFGFEHVEALDRDKIDMKDYVESRCGLALNVKNEVKC